MRYFNVLILLCFSSLAFSASSSCLQKARDSINKLEYTQAVELINQHLRNNVNDLKALHMLAKTYTWDNQYTQASQTYDRLLRNNNENDEYLFGKANALIWLEKNHQAVPYLEKAWRLQPENANYLKMLILTLKQTLDKDHLKRASELNVIANKTFPNMLWD